MPPTQTAKRRPQIIVNEKGQKANLVLPRDQVKKITSDLAKHTELDQIAPMDVIGAMHRKHIDEAEITKFIGFVKTHVGVEIGGRLTHEHSAFQEHPIGVSLTAEEKEAINAKLTIQDEKGAAINFRDLVKAERSRLQKRETHQDEKRGRRESLTPGKNESDESFKKRVSEADLEARYEKARETLTDFHGEDGALLDAIKVSNALADDKLAESLMVPETKRWKELREDPSIGDWVKLRESLDQATDSTTQTQIRRQLKAREKQLTSAKDPTEVEATIQNRKKIEEAKGIVSLLGAAPIVPDPNAVWDRLDDAGREKFLAASGDDQVKAAENATTLYQRILYEMGRVEGVKVIMPEPAAKPVAKPAKPTGIGETPKPEPKTPPKEEHKDVIGPTLFEDILKEMIKNQKDSPTEPTVITGHHNVIVHGDGGDVYNVDLSNTVIEAGATVIIGGKKLTGEDLPPGVVKRQAPHDGKSLNQSAAHRLNFAIDLSRDRLLIKELIVGIERFKPEALKLLANGQEFETGEEFINIMRQILEESGSPDFIKGRLDYNIGKAFGELAGGIGNDENLQEIKQVFAEKAEKYSSTENAKSYNQSMDNWIADRQLANLEEDETTRKFYLSQLSHPSEAALRFVQQNLGASAKEREKNWGTDIAEEEYKRDIGEPGSPVPQPDEPVTEPPTEPTVASGSPAQTDPQASSGSQASKTGEAVTPDVILKARDERVQVLLQNPGVAEYAQLNQIWADTNFDLELPMGFDKAENFQQLHRDDQDAGELLGCYNKIIEKIRKGMLVDRGIFSQQDLNAANIPFERAQTLEGDAKGEALFEALKSIDGVLVPKRKEWEAKARELFDGEHKTELIEFHDLSINAALPAFLRDPVGDARDYPEDVPKVRKLLQSLGFDIAADGKTFVRIGTEPGSARDANAPSSSQTPQTGEAITTEEVLAAQTEKLKLLLEDKDVAEYVEIRRDLNKISNLYIPPDLDKAQSVEEFDQGSWPLHERSRNVPRTLERTDYVERGLLTDDVVQDVIALVSETKGLDEKGRDQKLFEAYKKLDSATAPKRTKLEGRERELLRGESAEKIETYNTVQGSYNLKSFLDDPIDYAERYPSLVEDRKATLAALGFTIASDGKTIVRIKGGHDSAATHTPDSGSPAPVAPTAGPEPVVPKASDNGPPPSAQQTQSAGDIDAAVSARMDEGPVSGDRAYDLGVKVGDIIYESLGADSRAGVDLDSVLKKIRDLPRNKKKLLTPDGSHALAVISDGVIGALSGTYPSEEARIEANTWPNLRAALDSASNALTYEERVDAVASQKQQAYRPQEFFNGVASVLFVRNNTEGVAKFLRENKLTVEPGDISRLRELCQDPDAAAQIRDSIQALMENIDMKHFTFLEDEMPSLYRALKTAIQDKKIDTVHQNRITAKNLDHNPTGWLSYFADALEMTQSTIPPDTQRKSGPSTSSSIQEDDFPY
ncbi:MAG: hypothetical protein ABH950_03270 [Candidatus Altiarchaeota archaeon]